MPKLSRNDQLIQDAIKKAMDEVRDRMATGRYKSIIMTELETALLIHKGVSEREDIN